jgi:hypothetical protein
MAFSSPAFATRCSGQVISKATQMKPVLYLAESAGYLESLSSTTLGDEECVADDCLLTPQIYASSDDAEHKVEDNIFSKASIAFESTDFEHEPHLSQELEDAETAYEVAMMASAAHAFADAMEKENKQSMDAMLEREKEMKWIQEHEDDKAPYFLSPKINGAETNQRALLEARLDMERKAKVAAARRREMNQRALLAARFAMDKKSREVLETADANEIRSEWMESEALAATMGAYEHTVGLGSNAASTAQAGFTMEEAQSYETEETAEPSSKLTTVAERMILGEDIALDIALIEDAEGHDVTDTKNKRATVESPPQKKSITEVNQWRQDYIQEIKNYMQKKAVEQTKHRLSKKDAAKVNGTGSASRADDSQANKTTTIASFKPEVNVVKRALENGLIRRMNQHRRLIITALVMVLTRRLVLAWWGNAMRLI